MTVWTPQQISQARGIRAKVDIDYDLFAMDRDGAMDGLHRHLFAAMRQIAHPFAIELDAADIQLRAGDYVDAPPFRVEVRAWWEPDVKTIELHGGWKDGERMEYRDAPNPVKVALPPESPFAGDVATTPAPARLAETYTCVGWHEQARVWIYGPDSTGV